MAAFDIGVSTHRQPGAPERMPSCSSSQEGKRIIARLTKEHQVNVLTPFRDDTSMAELSSFSEHMERRMDGPDGEIGHAEVRIGDSVLMVGFRPWSELPVSSVHVYVDDVDRVYARALEQGAASLAAPRDLPYGDRSAGVRDAQGNYWWIGTRLTGQA